MSNLVINPEVDVSAIEAQLLSVLGTRYYRNALGIGTITLGPGALGTTTLLTVPNVVVPADSIVVCMSTLPCEVSDAADTWRITHALGGTTPGVWDRTGLKAGSSTDITIFPATPITVFDNPAPATYTAITQVDSMIATGTFEVSNMRTMHVFVIKKP